MIREKEPKNAFARKIQKLTRSRSSSTAPAFSSPPSPTDYFTPQGKPENSPPAASSFSAPLTPVTPTGLPGTVVGADTEAAILTAQEELAASCPYCKLSTEPSAISQCCCYTPEPSDLPVESEAMADKMAQKILHQVVSQSEQGWTI